MSTPIQDQLTLFDNSLATLLESIENIGELPATAQQYFLQFQSIKEQLEALQITRAEDLSTRRELLTVTELAMQLLLTHPSEPTRLDG